MAVQDDFAHPQRRAPARGGRRDMRVTMLSRTTDKDNVYLRLCLSQKLIRHFGEAPIFPEMKRGSFRIRKAVNGETGCGWRNSNHDERPHYDIPVGIARKLNINGRAGTRVQLEEPIFDGEWVVF